MRNTLLKILFITASFLLLAHLISDFFILEKSFGSEQEEKLISTEDLLLKVFDEHGIQTSWISTVTSRKKIDTLTTEYRVQIPADVPIPLIIRDLQSLFNNEEQTISATETEINGRSFVTIASKDNYRVVTEFVRNRNIKRVGITASFIINEFNNLRRTDAEILLNTDLQFCVLLNPAASNEAAASEIVNNKKEYALLISGEIREIAFRFDKNFSRQRLRDSFVNMLTTFPAVKLIVYDDDPDFMTPDLNDVMNTFAERNKIKLLPLSKIKKSSHDLEESSTQNFLPDDGINFINATTLLNNYEELLSFRKKGNRILYPTELIK